jgi:hypothetical protein
MTSPAWSVPQRLFGFLSGLASMVDFVPEIFIYGHLPFHAYVRRIGIRPSDHVFTVVRDPIDMMISQANYNAGLLAKDPTAQRPDTRQVMQRLGIEQFPNPAPAALLREFALRMLLNSEIARPNRICNQFGNGNAEASIENLISQDVEVTDLPRYRRWLKERWNIETKSQHNRSLAILSRADVTEHLDYLRSQTALDQQVFDLVSRALDRAETSSLRGSSLA